MISRVFTTISCGSREDHDEHFHVKDGTKYGCFGYHAPKGAAAPEAKLEEEKPQNGDVSICKHCARAIDFCDGKWLDMEADGDDMVWSETCDSNDEDRIAAHEPDLVELVHDRA